MTHPTKLTLRLDSGLIESAKAFAHEHQRSLSQLVADYFARLAAQPTAGGATTGMPARADDVRPLGPITTSLRGVLAGASSKTNGHSKPLGIEDYRAYLVENHK